MEILLAVNTVEAGQLENLVFFTGQIVKDNNGCVTVVGKEL